MGTSGGFPVVILAGTPGPSTSNTWLLGSSVLTGPGPGWLSLKCRSRLSPGLMPGWEGALTKIEVDQSILKGASNNPDLYERTLCAKLLTTASRRAFAHRVRSYKRHKPGYSRFL
jgi:hypothetical protein